MINVHRYDRNVDRESFLINVWIIFDTNVGNNGFLG